MNFVALFLGFCLQLVGFFLVIGIPLYRTYYSLLDTYNTKRWGLYWGIFAWALFFHQFFKPYIITNKLLYALQGIVFVLFHCWLYFNEFWGSLCIGRWVHESIRLNNTCINIFNIIGKYVNFLTVFEQIPIVKVRKMEAQSQKIIE